MSINRMLAEIFTHGGATAMDAVHVLDALFFPD